MDSAKEGQSSELPRKPLVWLHGEVKKPPFTPQGRQKAGICCGGSKKGSNWACRKRNPCHASDRDAEP